MLNTEQELGIFAGQTTLLPQSRLSEFDTGKSCLVVVFRQDQLGSGDGNVGKKLLVPYLEALLQMPLLPSSILFYNTGVRLLVEEGEVTKLLSQLEQKGCELLACNLSLKQLALSCHLKIGEISTLEIMLDRQIKADKILWP